MSLKHNLCMISLGVAMIILLSSCSVNTSLSLTYKIENGDKIKVTLNTSDGHSLSQEENATIVVKKGDEAILQGVFLTNEMYDGYINSIRSTEGITIVEENDKDGSDYIFYQFEGQSGTENTFIIKVKDSNTGALLASLSPKEDAKAAFEMLSFEKVD